jgi:hypothetical protein
MATAAAQPVAPFQVALNDYFLEWLSTTEASEFVRDTVNRLVAARQAEERQRSFRAGRAVEDEGAASIAPLTIGSLQHGWVPPQLLHEVSHDDLAIAAKIAGGSHVVPAQPVPHAEAKVGDAPPRHLLPRVLSARGRVRRCHR